MSTAPLTITEVARLMGISRTTLYKHFDKLVSAGVLQEALPRLGDPRYLAAPILRWMNGEPAPPKRATSTVLSGR